jgi:hypothetical protein
MMDFLGVVLAKSAVTILSDEGFEARVEFFQYNRVRSV